MPLIPCGDDVDAALASAAGEHLHGEWLIRKWRKGRLSAEEVIDGARNCCEAQRRSVDGEAGKDEPSMGATGSTQTPSTDATISQATGADSFQDPVGLGPKLVK